MKFADFELISRSKTVAGTIGGSSDLAKPPAYKASQSHISEAMIKSRETASDAVERVEKADEQAKRLNFAAERGVTVYAYDDRGMDITATRPDPIAELYSRFDAWLLDYDRPRMSEAFAVKETRVQ